MQLQMSLLPSDNTPLNRHSLVALELWLNHLGAEKSSLNPCLWTWSLPAWTVEIQMEQDELRVTWEKNGERNQRCFSYGLSRLDVEAAINEGP